MIPTQTLNDTIKNMYCEHYNIDDITTEVYYESFETINVGDKTFYPLLLKIIKNGKRIISVVPASVKETKPLIGCLSYISYEYDWNTMENDIKKIIEIINEENC